jgi:hypothetical protein
METHGKQVVRDAFGYGKLDSVNLGQWCTTLFSDRIGTARDFVQEKWRLRALDQGE